jgi:hypothetical protein
MSESPDVAQSPRPPKRKRRVYQACEPCRLRKAKCDRGSDGKTLQHSSSLNDPGLTASR